MSLARRYQVAGNTLLTLGGFVFVAISVLAATHPTSVWLLSIMLTAAAVGVLGGLHLRGFGGHQLNLDASRAAEKASRDAQEASELMIEVGRQLMAAQPALVRQIAGTLLGDLRQYHPSPVRAPAHRTASDEHEDDEHDSDKVVTLPTPGVRKALERMARSIVDGAD